VTHSQSDLNTICAYLDIPVPSLVRSREADDNHRRNPRLFAFVVDGSDTINVCAAMETIPADVRIGLLLHELGHLRRSMDEVEADEWVLIAAPESGYHYEAEVTFKSPLYKEPVTAKNIQCVSNQFMRTIGHLEED
jgi:hypothetical protein